MNLLNQVDQEIHQLGPADQIPQRLPVLCLCLHNPLLAEAQGNAIDERFSRKE